MVETESANIQSSRKANGCHTTNKYVKFARHEIYSSKAVILSFFCATFAMPFIFLLLFNCTTKASEFFDMAKS